MLDSMPISNPSTDDSYITSGDRLYVIGAQDGRFPAIGDHVKGEMGGIWAHPIKLADGFDLRLNGRRLPPARRFTVGPYFTEFEYTTSESISVVRSQFVPDSEPVLVVRYRFRSALPGDFRITFALACDFRPVWLSELDGVVPGGTQEEYDEQIRAWHCSDKTNEWHVFVGAAGLAPEKRSSGPVPLGQPFSHGHGIAVDLEYLIRSDGNPAVTFIVAGGAGDAEELRDAFRRASNRAPAMERAKRTRYASMIERSQISLPDASIERAWNWLKCNNDWLVRDVPGVGRGIGAGAPEYVWWFGCDTAYAVPSLLALGQADLARDTLDLLRVLSCTSGSTGRVIHEATTTGRVANPGCTEETAQFAAAVREVVFWTGDRPFLERNYDFCRRGVLDWVLGAMDSEGRRMPAGYGIVEIEGLDLYCLDVLVHTIAAVDALAQLAAIMDDTETLTRCAGLEPILRSRLESEFWVESAGMYADIVGSSREMMPRLRDWKERYEPLGGGELLSVLDRAIDVAASDADPDRLRPWVLGNWTAVCPLDAELASEDRAVRVLERLERPDYSRRWGMAVNGFDPDSIVMSLPTGVLASAEAAYVRWDRALRYIRTVVETLPFAMPGAISEISPDAGCFVQAWSAYAITQPLLRHMFGFRPDALRRHIAVTPSFPPGWDGAALRNLPIGGTTCTLVWKRGELSVTVDEDGWNVTVGPSRPDIAGRGVDYRDG